MKKIISSTQNKSIKNILHLQEKSRNRRKSGLFVVEGLRELQLAIEAEYSFPEIYYCSELIGLDQLTFLKSKTTTFTEVTQEVYGKIAYRAGTEGVLGVGKQKRHELESVKFTREHPLVLVAEAPEKPGNIGALLRTADAAALDAVFIANPRTDLYNPNIIRSSVGCIFTNQVVTGSTTEILDFLKNRRFQIYCATLQSSEPYHTQDFTQATAIVVGTEADGLSEEWRKHSTQNILIPMQGKIDSMNVSVSAGILLFEAKRQRNFQ